MTLNKVVSLEEHCCLADLGILFSTLTIGICASTGDGGGDVDATIIILHANNVHQCIRNGICYIVGTILSIYYRLVDIYDQSIVYLYRVLS